jgi:ABC-type transporter Mla MlaB component
MGESAVKMTKRKTMTVVAISGPMTINMISELKSVMLKAFSLGKEVQMSLAGVTEVDLTGLQLICSSHRTSVCLEQDFSVTGAEGEALSSVSQLAGMTRHTGCAQDINSTCVWKKQE